MGKIFCLMGKTASGKDSLAKKLLEDKYLNLSPIVLHTTRPIRTGEQEGREYYFINEEILANLKSEGKVIESRSYNTTHGIWSYATIASDSTINLEQNNYLTVNTLEGYKKLVSYYGRDTVIPIYIYLDFPVRFERAFHREEKEQNPKFKEMCRRFIEDEKDFSEINLMDAEIFEENKYINDNFDICLKEIKNTVQATIQSKKQKTRKI